jgi:hypothetical protein
MKRTVAAVGAIAVLIQVALAGCTSEGSPEPPEPPAIQVPAEVETIDAQIAQYDRALYVYRDAADGFNHFTVPLWTGANDPGLPVPPLNDGAEGRPTTGSSSHLISTGIQVGLDFAVHPSGGYVWTNGYTEAGGPPQPNWGQADAALDLSGATKLVFDAKGDTGTEQVGFFVGGIGYADGQVVAEFPDSTDRIGTGVINLPAEWTRYEIPLDGADLRHIAGGFGWSASAEQNPDAPTLGFTLDNIYFEFADARPGPLLLPSYELRWPGTPGAEINNFAYTYDNALAIVALTYAERYDRARQLADAFVYAIEHDRTFTDGRVRNAYLAGPPQSFPGWLSASGQEYARLPQFWLAEDGAWHEDVTANSTSTGNLAWAMLALTEVARHSPEDAPYLAAAQRIGSLLISLSGASDGFTGGFEGWDDAQVQVTYKSTEHNIDLYSAFRNLSSLMGDRGSTAWAVTYAAGAEKARLLVQSMFDPECSCFHTGTRDDGVEVNTDVVPLDTNAWAVLALGDDLVEAGQVMDFIKDSFTVGDGFDFNNDLDGVWFEGTAFMKLCFESQGDAESAGRVLEFLLQNQLQDATLPAADHDGLTTGFGWTYDRRAHLGATAWLGLAQMNRNPLHT